ncbi:YesL family protein [Anaerobium acetethylicum]|uniref:Uncharacterized membrane protein YesL n=1 Tax=Anaerobium acetethylicum TaxID=1619234 RepID=A0A1D3TRM9_9FIRM|nr:DUF624 domain-containing protein [Anaerobium acetethylicum]SCP96388.1 Uncharacterized membrane protein YesL [Anaerobium acetethylicum]
MNNLFSMDNKFFTFMNKVADLIILNILWLICCIPIVTAGASTTALFYSTIKLVRGEESYVSKDFFKSFRENLKQGILIWLIMLLAGLIIGADFYILYVSDISYKIYILPVFLFIALIYYIILLYIFPLLSKFENTTKNMFKNALLIGIRNLPLTILLGIFTGIIAVTAYIFVALIPLWLFLGVALAAYLASFIYSKIFEKIILSNDEADKDDKEGQDDKTE